MRRRIGLIVVALTLLVTACNAGDGGGGSTIAGEGTSGSASGGRGGGSAGSASGSGVRALHASLQQFDQCDALLGWIRSEAADRVGPYGFDGGGGWVTETTVVDDMDDAATEVPMADGEDLAGATLAGGTEYSTTNVQEAGVDEADIVKTDGERIFFLAEDSGLSFPGGGSTLHVIDATSSSPQRLDSLRLTDVYPTDLLLGDDRLYVISTAWNEAVVPEAGDVAESSPELWSGQEIVVVTEVAVAADGTLTETARLEIEGGYVTARQIGDGVRLVLRDDPQTRLPFVYPSGSHAEDDATARNRDVVVESTIEDWLPTFRLTTADGEPRSGILADCDRVTAPQEFSGMSTISVLTLTMGQPLDSGEAMTLFGAADTVYASSSSLYAATYIYPDVIPLGDEPTPNDPDPDFATQIHRFDITDPEGAGYVASGEVQGRLLNQFALSEHEDHLRVATTEGSPWFCCEEETSSSSVVVMRTEGEALVEVGIVEDLGIGESIFGVRFVGDRGYVVTFRQTDPLYVVDLSDPEAPAVEGELKITGYSSYLHPVTEDLVLGVGQEATEDGMTTGTKVSLFDVSDPNDPREVDRWILENRYSPVEWDHRAFLYWAPEQLAVVPVETWGEDEFGAVGLRVSGDTLTEVGRITQHRAEDGGLNPACTPIEPADIPDTSELFWIIRDGGAIVQCPEGEAPAGGRFQCEPVDNWGKAFEDELAEHDVAGKTTDVCWPEYDEGRSIQRSIVIGDTLWTVGRFTVQANDLATLEPTGWVDL